MRELARMAGLAACVCWVGAALGQPATQPADGPGAEDQPHRDLTMLGDVVVVQPEYAPLDAVVRAQLDVQRGDWPAAAASHHRAILEHGRALFPVGEGLNRSVADVLTDRILSWPLPGRQAYLRVAEEPASSALEEAEQSGNLAALLEVVQLYLPTAAGARAALLAADNLADQGELAGAVLMLRRLERHPEADRWEVRARLACWLAWQGQREEAQAILKLAEEQGLADKPTLGRLREAMEDPLPVGLHSDWAPILGGSPSRNRTIRTMADAGAAMWTRPYRDLREELRDQLQQMTNRQNRQRVSPEQFVAQAVNSGAFQEAVPVASDQLLILQVERSLHALSLASGERVWSFDAPRGSADGSRGTVYYGAQSFAPRPMASPTLAGQGVFAVFNPPTAANFGWGSVAVSGGSLVHLDLANGQLRFRVDFDTSTDLPPVLRGSLLDTSPLALDNSLYLVARKRQAAGAAANEDVYLVCLDAQTGRYRWHVFLSSAPPANWAVRHQSLVSAGYGRIHVVTQAGALAAVDAHTGRKAWVLLYPRRALPAGYGWRAQAAEERSTEWMVSPAMYHRGMMAIQPQDSDQVLLVDAADGAMRASVPLARFGGSAGLLGVMDDRFILASGQKIFALDPASLEPLTTWDLRGSTLAGRPAVTEGGVFLAAGSALMHLLSDGTTRSYPIEAGQEAGHILAVPQQLLMVGPQTVTAFCRWEDARVRLLAAIDARPESPAARLDFAEVALRANAENLPAAVEQYDEAIRLAGGYARLSNDVRERVHRGLLNAARQLREENRTTPARIEELLKRAYRCPPDATRAILTLLEYAEFLAANGRPAESIDKLHEIVATDQLRQTLIAVPGRAEQSQAGLIARRRIERLVAETGQASHRRLDELAEAKFAKAVTEGTEAKLMEVARLYPAAPAARRALQKMADLARERGDHLAEYRALELLWVDYFQIIQREDRGMGARLVAELAGSAMRRGNRVSTRLWLQRGRSIFGDAEFELQPGEPRQSFELLAQRLLEASLLEDQTLPSLPPELPHTYTIRLEGNARIYSPTVQGVSRRHDLLILWMRNQLHVLHAATGEPVHPPISIEMPRDVLAVLHDRIILHTNQSILALCPVSRRVLWQQTTSGGDTRGDPEHVEQWTQAHAMGDHVVAIRERRSRPQATFVSISMADGSLRWQRSTTRKPADPLQISSDRYFAYAMPANPEGTPIVVVDADDGAEIHILTSAAGETFAAYGFSPDGVLVAVSETRIVSFSSRQGEPAFEPIETPTATPRSLTFTLDGFLLMHNASLLTKRSYETGEVLWNADAAIADRASNRPVPPVLFAEADHVLVGSQRQVYGFDLATGELLWEGVPLVNQFGHFANTRDILVGFNRRQREGAGRQAGEQRWIVNLYQKRTQGGSLRAGKLMREMDLGDLGDLRSVAVRDRAVILQTKDEIVVRTADRPMSARVVLVPEAAG